MKKEKQATRIERIFVESPWFLDLPSLLCLAAASWASYQLVINGAEIASLKRAAFLGSAVIFWMLWIASILACWLAPIRKDE